MPTRARITADHANAKKMSRLTDASSRKSTLSAKRETEPNRDSDRELDPKIAQVQQRHEQDGSS